MSHDLTTRLFFCGLSDFKIPIPAKEFRFDLTRRWRADWCWTSEKLIMEVDGGLFSGGRHARGAGIVRDNEKLNRAAELGYRVIKIQPKDLLTKETARLIASCLNIKINIAYEQKVI